MEIHTLRSWLAGATGATCDAGSADATGATGATAGTSLPYLLLTLNSLGLVSGILNGKNEEGC